MYSIHKTSEAKSIEEMINACQQQSTESFSEVKEQAEPPPTSTTLGHNLGRPHVEAINYLANIGNGLQRCWVDCICFKILKNDEASSTLVQSPSKFLIQNHLG